MNIVCNEHVRCELELHGTYQDLYQFLPDNGYALWRDNETGNIDSDTGEPWCYWLSIGSTDSEVESFAPHVWAKLIDDSMMDYSKLSSESKVLKMRAVSLPDSEILDTYIDENGIEQTKRGIY